MQPIRFVVAAALVASACLGPVKEQCNEPGLGCPPDGGTSGGRAGGTAGGTTSGGAAGGFGGGGFAGGAVGGGGFAGGAIGGGGFAGGAIGGGGFSGGRAGGTVGGGGVGGGRAGGTAGGRAGGSAGGRGGGFAGGGFGGGGFGGGGFSGGFAGGFVGGGFAGGFSGGFVGGGFAGGFSGGFVGGGFAGGFGGGFVQGGESCFGAIVLSVPSTINGTTRGFQSNHQFRPSTPPSCRFTGVNSPDVVYAFDVPPGRTVTVNLTPAGWDAVIDLVADPTLCGAPNQPSMSCLAGADDPERLTYANPSTFTQTVYLVVTGFTPNSIGDFTLSLSIADGERCESPVALSPNTTLFNEPLGTFINDYQGAGSGCAPRSVGSDRVYRVTVPARSELAVDVRPNGVDTNVSFSLFPTQCSPRQCAGTMGDGFGIGVPDRGTYQNISSVPVDVLVIVDSAALAPGSSFSITASTTPIMSVGDTCLSPQLIGANTFLPNENLTGLVDNYQSSPSCDFRFGPDRVYAVDVPGGTTLTVQVQPFDVTFSPGLSIAADQPSCQSGFCVASAPPSPMGKVAVATNATTFLRRYFIVVDGQPGSSGQTSYGLSTSLSVLTVDAGVFDAGVVDAGLPDAGFGESCSSSTPLPIGTPIGVNLSGSSNDTSSTSTCPYGPGGDRMYSVTLAPQQRLTVVASPQAPFDVSLSLTNDALSCLIGACVTSANVGAVGASETLTFDNTGASPRSFVVILDSLTPMSGTVGLFASITNINSAGDTCANAIPINSSTTLLGQTTSGLNKDYTLPMMSCVDATGPEAVFAVPLLAGQSLRVVMTSVDDAVINIVPGPASTCGVAACLANADNGATGSEDVIFQNGPAAQTVFVLLSRWANGTLTYDVAFTIQ